MEVAAIILAALLIVGFILWFLDKRSGESVGSEESLESEESEISGSDNTPDSSDISDGSDIDQDEVCCGQHYSCEKDSLLTALSSKIEYYEDEDLDRFAGRRPDEYSEEEKDEFRDVMLTLLPDDLAGWGRSIQLRGISLPSDIRDEFLMLIDDVRTKRLTPQA